MVLKTFCLGASMRGSEGVQLFFGHKGIAIDAIVEALVEEVRPGDVVITLGAGHINQVCGALLERLGAA